MTKFVSVTDAGGRVRKFEPEHFISADDQPDGICLVTTHAGMFATRNSASKVEAAVKNARTAED